MRALPAALAAALLALAPPVTAPSPGDADDDGFPDAAERLLGSSPYDASDSPAAVGPNAITNPGFELQAQTVAQLVTCPVFGDTSQNIGGLVIVSPCYASALRAAGWSTGQTSSAQAAAQAVDVDGDGDLEMRVPSPAHSSHSFWHAFANAQQAFSADFDALTFDLESDGASLAALPAAARVQVSVSLSPFNDAHPFVAVYVECSLTFTKAVMLAHAAATPVPGPAGQGYLHVSVDPVKAVFGSSWSGCDPEAAAYNSGLTDDQKRAMLRGMRLVQTSFWAFDGQVVDNVDLRGSKPPAGVPDNNA